MPNRLAVTLGVSVFLLGGSLAHAQATRTWVSGVGDDVNPCSRTAPCKTFAGAISKTAAGGEINVLDPGGFGALTITKSISVVNEGSLGGVLAAGTNGFVINAGVNDVVVLRGLDINGAGTGLNGIRFLAGKALHVENCTIYGFTQKGIDVQPSTVSQVYVKDTIVRNNNTTGTGGGILIKPTVSGSVEASLDGVRLERNVFGLRAEDDSKVTVRNSLAAGNATNGFLALSAGVPVDVNLESVVSTNNGTSGVRSTGGGATVRISNATITNNAEGLTAVTGGAIVSFENNRNAGNGVNGAPTSTVPPQ